MIYENDIPQWPIRNPTEKFVSQWNHERTGRWKLFGITNNIEQYETKAGLKGETNLKKRMWKHALRKAVYNYCKKQRYSAN